MAETQEGGIYIVGKGTEARYVDASGKDTTRQKSDASQNGGQGGSETWPYADVLAPAGFRTWAQVQDATDEALLDVDGIGPKRLGEIRAWKPA